MPTQLRPRTAMEALRFLRDHSHIIANMVDIKEGTQATGRRETSKVKPRSGAVVFCFLQGYHR